MANDDVHKSAARSSIGLQRHGGVAYDAVVVAGALYMNRWHRHARRFVRGHTPALRGRPVWLVSSGEFAAVVVAASVTGAEAVLSRPSARPSPRPSP